MGPRVSIICSAYVLVPPQRRHPLFDGASRYFPIPGHGMFMFCIERALVGRFVAPVSDTYAASFLFWRCFPKCKRHANYFCDVWLLFLVQPVVRLNSTGGAYPVFANPISANWWSHVMRIPRLRHFTCICRVCTSLAQLYLGRSSRYQIQTPSIYDTGWFFAVRSSFDMTETCHIFRPHLIQSSCHGHRHPLRHLRDSHYGYLVLVPINNQMFWDLSIQQRRHFDIHMYLASYLSIRLMLP